MSINSKDKLDVNIVSKILIPHESYENCLEELHYLLDSVGKTSYPVYGFIVGASGVGKSTVIESFTKKFPVRYENGIRMCEVVYAEIPPKGTIGGLMENLLIALGDPHWSTGTATNKFNRLRNYLEKSGCKMIILDEFQHLADKGQNITLENTRDWLKSLTNARKWALVACGIPYAKNVNDEAEQMWRRSDAVITIPRFDWHNENLNAQFRIVLMAFQKGVVPFRTPNFKDDEIVFQFYIATKGLIALIVKILTRAIYSANKDNRQFITLDDLSFGFRKAVWFSTQFEVGQGPFEKNFVASAHIDKIKSYEDEIRIAEENKIHKPKKRKELKGTKKELDKLLKDIF